MLKVSWENKLIKSWSIEYLKTKSLIEPWNNAYKFLILNKNIFTSRMWINFLMKEGIFSFFCNFFPIIIIFKERRGYLKIEYFFLVCNLWCSEGNLFENHVINNIKFVILFVKGIIIIKEDNIEKKQTKNNHKLISKQTITN